MQNLSDLSVCVMLPTLMLCVWAEQWWLLFTYLLYVVYKLSGTFFVMLSLSLNNYTLLKNLLSEPCVSVL